MDAFGLLGIAATFQLIVFVFDGCNLMSRLVAREVAASKSQASQRALSLFAAGERRYLALMALGAAGSLALALPIAKGLVNTSSLAALVIGQALLLIGFATFIKLLASYYRGCVVGLHAQVPANVISLAANILRFPGAYVCILVVPDVRVFLGFQLLSFVLEAVWLRLMFRRRVSDVARPQPELGAAVLRDEGRFIATSLALAAITVLAGQVDKVMLASTLSLRAFGAASLAILMCGGLFVLATPIHQIYLPRLAAAFQAGDARASQLAAAVIATLLCVSVPAAATLLLCAPAIAGLVAPPSGADLAQISDAFVLWGLGNCIALTGTGLYLVYFSAGHIGRYAALQLAYLAVYLPMSWWAVQSAGLQGAGSAWVLGNLLMLLMLAVDLARQRSIGREVLVMLAGAAIGVSGAFALSGIIQPLLPASRMLAAGVTALVYAISLALTVLALYPTLKRSGHT